MSGNGPKGVYVKLSKKCVRETNQLFWDQVVYERSHGITLGPSGVFEKPSMFWLQENDLGSKYSKYINRVAMLGTLGMERHLETSKSG